MHKGRDREYKGNSLETSEGAPWSHWEKINERKGSTRETQGTFRREYINVTGERGSDIDKGGKCELTGRY